MKIVRRERERPNTEKFYFCFMFCRTFHFVAKIIKKGKTIAKASYEAKEEINKIKERLEWTLSSELTHNVKQDISRDGPQKYVYIQERRKKACAAIENWSPMLFLAFNLSILLIIYEVEEMLWIYHNGGEFIDAHSMTDMMNMYGDEVNGLSLSPPPPPPVINSMYVKMLMISESTYFCDNSLRNCI